MPPKGSKSKKEKPTPVLEPPQLQPAQEEADKTTNVKVKKKKVVTTFKKEKKQEIIECLLLHEILYSKQIAGFKDVNKKEDLWAAQDCQPCENLKCYWILQAQIGIEKTGELTKNLSLFFCDPWSYPKPPS